MRGCQVRHLHRLPKSWIRNFHQTSALASRSIRPVKSADIPPDRSVSKWFMRHAFDVEKPFLMRHDHGRFNEQFPCISMWFWNERDLEMTFSHYMRLYMFFEFPFEVTLASPDAQDTLLKFYDWLHNFHLEDDLVLLEFVERIVQESRGRAFYRLVAPLRLLLRALQFNILQKESGLDSMMQVYMAQLPLHDIPIAWQQDINEPDLIKIIGNGDIYGTSLWMGTEPTYTPLHRDPNPNLFYQLHSAKVFRLLPPAAGERLFMEVQQKLGRTANSRIRTVEMMEGPERALLHEAIWAPDTPHKDAQETVVAVSETLYIPKGWWHSVKSLKSDGELNASVNWWFR